MNINILSSENMRKANSILEKNSLVSVKACDKIKKSNGQLPSSLLKKEKPSVQ